MQQLDNKYIFIKTKPAHHPPIAAEKKCKTPISDRTSIHKSNADSNKFYTKFVEALLTLDDLEHSIESIQNDVRGKLKEFEHHGVKFTDKTIQGLISDKLITKAEIAALEDLYEINIKVIPDQNTESTKEEFHLELVRSVQTGTQTSDEQMFNLTNTNPAHIHYAVTSAIGLAAWFCNYNVKNFIQLYVNICTANNMPILELPESFINLILESQKAQSFDWNLLYKAMAYMEQDHAPNEVCLEQEKASNYALRESKKNDMFKFSQDETNSIIDASRSLAESFNIENADSPITNVNISASRNPAETFNIKSLDSPVVDLSDSNIIDLTESNVSKKQYEESNSLQGITVVTDESNSHQGVTLIINESTDSVDSDSQKPDKWSPKNDNHKSINDQILDLAMEAADIKAQGDTDAVKNTEHIQSGDNAVSPNNTVNSSQHHNIMHPSLECIESLEKSINELVRSYNL